MNFVDFARKITIEVEKSIYREYVKSTFDINAIRVHFIPANSELLNTNKEFASCLRYYIDSQTRGLTLKDDIILKYIKDDGLEDKYLEGDIIIFEVQYPEGTAEEDGTNQYLSVLTHELMHAMFKGIPNDSECGAGYDEACTDFLAENFFGEKYFTTYKQLVELKRGTNCLNENLILMCYSKFDEMSEIEKSVVLNHYFNGEPVE